MTDAEISRKWEKYEDWQFDERLDYIDYKFCPKCCRQSIYTDGGWTHFDINLDEEIEITHYICKYCRYDFCEQ